MNEESRKRFGNSIGSQSDLDVFTWEIRNISSIPHVVDYVVKSPSFLFAGATWLFKMYPYGQTVHKTEGYIDMIIERLHSEIEEHRLDCKLYCKNFLDKEVKFRSRTYIFNKRFPYANAPNLMKNLKECPNNWHFAPNDVFTFICAFEKRYNGSESDFQTGKTCITSRETGIQGIGEIFSDRLLLRNFYWKLCGIECLEFPEDYPIKSPSFSFASASWVLKIYPHFRLEQLSESSYDVVLCRLHSEIPEHCVAVEIALNWTCHTVVTENFVFNLYCSQGNAVHIPLKKENIPGLRCLHMDFELIVKNGGLQLDSSKKLGTSSGSDTIPKSFIVLQNNKILQDYKDLFLNRSDCDVTVKVKGQEFAAHSVILKARSPVLASTFRNDMKEKATGIIDIEDCCPSVFSDFLRFLYCGELESLSVETVFSLFTIADKYDVPDLRTNCMNFIKTNISVDTFCDTIALALLHSESELKDLCIDFFAKNLQDIIVTVKWQSFILENPIQGNELLIKVPNKK